MASPATLKSAGYDRRDSDRLGIKVHNLVFTRDSGEEYYEFRVQCEIRIYDSDPDAASKARTILEAVASPKSGTLTAVRDIVTPHIHPEASQKFRSTVASAFEEFIRDRVGRAE